MDNEIFELTLADFKDVVETYLAHDQPTPEQMVKFIKELNEVMESHRTSPIPVIPEILQHKGHQCVSTMH